MYKHSTTNERVTHWLGRPGSRNGTPPTKLLNPPPLPVRCPACPTCPPAHLPQPLATGCHRRGLPLVGEEDGEAVRVAVRRVAAGVGDGQHDGREELVGRQEEGHKKWCRQLVGQQR